MGATGVVPSQALVIFGASGDLTLRKIIPALFELESGGHLPDQFAVFGYSRSALTDESFRGRVLEVLPDGSDTSSRQKLLSRLHYITGEFDSENCMAHLGADLSEADQRLGTEGHHLFYAATPPSAFPLIARRLREAALTSNSRIVVEKPFGSDLAGARVLNDELHRSFDESQIFRIDHYLGKETVQNILAFRFSNGMFEPIWNRRYVSQVQIEVAEDIGIGNRAEYYEGSGAIRDIVQNHVMQLLSVLAMEPPVSFEAESIRDEKVKLLTAVEPVLPHQVVRGQYASGSIDGEAVKGYREEEGVDSASNAETFAAMRLSIANWRWAGVPFLVRTGKRLARRATQVTIVFHDAPHLLFKEEGVERPDPNRITLRIQPNEGIALTFDAKVPGPEMQVAPVSMDFQYSGSFGDAPPGAYERLLRDAMIGDQTLFLRADEIERAWMILAEVLERTEPDFYPAGTTGPKRAQDLVPGGRWYLATEPF